MCAVSYLSGISFYGSSGSCRPTCLSLGPIGPDKSSAPAGPKPRCVEESLPFDQFRGWSTRNVNRPRASGNIHASADGAAGIHASLNRYRITQGIRRSAAKSVLAAIFQNQLDGGAKVCAAFFDAVPLPVGAGNLRRPSDKPFAIAFDHSCEFVPHGTSIDRHWLCGNGKWGGGQGNRMNGILMTNSSFASPLRG